MMTNKTNYEVLHLVVPLHPFQIQAATIPPSPPPTPVPPISNIPMLKVRDLTYSKAFHARIEKQVKKIHSYDSQGKSLHSK